MSGCVTSERRVLFRLDCNHMIGSGHFMRCLTLADALSHRGVACSFLSRDLPQVWQQRLQAHGHCLLALPPVASSGICPSCQEPELAHSHWLGLTQQDDAEQCKAMIASVDQVFDVLIVDHYALDRRWTSVMRKVAHCVMVIDDLADRVHDCDVLLDQNLGRAHEDYDGLVPDGAQRLVGPCYALLREEFQSWRDVSLMRKAEGTVNKGLISLGGVDADNLSGLCLSYLVQAAGVQGGRWSALELTVVLGAQSMHVDEVKALARQAPWPVEVLQGVDNMAQRLAQVDWAIGAAGASAWERCCLGVPSLVLILAANQAPGANALAGAGAAVLCRMAGTHLAKTDFLEQMQYLFSQLRPLSSAAASLCDGRGVARVVSELEPWFEN